MAVTKDKKKVAGNHKSGISDPKVKAAEFQGKNAWKRYKEYGHTEEKFEKTEKLYQMTDREDAGKIFRLPDLRKKLEENANDYAKVKIPEKVRVSRPDEPAVPFSKGWKNHENDAGLQCIVWEAFVNGQFRDTRQFGLRSGHIGLQKYLFRTLNRDVEGQERSGSSSKKQKEENTTETNSHNTARNEANYHLEVKKVAMRTIPINGTEYFNVTTLLYVIEGTTHKMPFTVTLNFNKSDKDAIRQFIGC